jgi:hypothetical protein
VVGGGTAIDLSGAVLYAFFFERLTGLSITVISVITLFIGDAGHRADPGQERFSKYAAIPPHYPARACRWWNQS